MKTISNPSVRLSNCRSWFVASLLAVACTTAMAQTAKPPATPPGAGFEFTGAGVITCKEMLALSQTPASAVQFEQWLLGFLAAHNAYASVDQRVKMPPSARLMAYATDVCKANPNVRFISVASAALQQLGAKVAALQ